MEEMLLFSCFVCAFRMDLTVSLRVLLLSPVAKGLITALAWKPLERNATFRPSIAALDFLFKLPKKNPGGCCYFHLLLGINSDFFSFNFESY